VRDGSRWTVRVGALLLLSSPFLPHGDLDGKAYGPLLLCMDGRDPLGTRLTPLGLAAWLFLPSAAGAAILLADVGRRAASGPTLAVLMACSFALATAGSVLLTQTSAGPSDPQAPFGLALAMFVAPLVLGGVVLARFVGGHADRSPGGFDRLSLGLLVALQGVYLLDGGWEILLAYLKYSGTAHVRPGAWAAPLGGVLVAAGEILRRLRPLAAVDTVAASG
jgi:hypothetical protein